MAIEARIDLAGAKEYFPNVPRMYVHEGGFEKVYKGKLANVAQDVLPFLSSKQQILKTLNFAIPVIWGYKDSLGPAKMIELFGIKGIKTTSENPEVLAYIYRNFDFYNTNNISCGEGWSVIAAELQNMWQSRDFEQFMQSLPDLTDRLQPRKVASLSPAPKDSRKWELKIQDQAPTKINISYPILPA